MLFRSKIKNVNLLNKFCASLASLGQIAWCRLTDEDVRFTVIPDKGSQIWSILRIESVFENYTLQSIEESNMINLEIPIQVLQRALKSALGATDALIRLTKKDNVPMLRVTIVTNSYATGSNALGSVRNTTSDEYEDFDLDMDLTDSNFGGTVSLQRERQTVVTQDIPVKVLRKEAIHDLLQPRTNEPEVYIFLPPLLQVKNIAERFTRLAMATKTGSGGSSPRLDLSANMHGSFKIAVTTDALSISSVWKDLFHPELRPEDHGGLQGLQDHPTTKMKELGGPNGENEAGWAKVHIDAKDWSRVLSVGRLSTRVVAGFLHEDALVLYVYISNEEHGGEESCLTYYIGSFSA